METHIVTKLCIHFGQYTEPVEVLTACSKLGLTGCTCQCSKLSILHTVGAQACTVEILNKAFPFWLSLDAARDEIRSHSLFLGMVHISGCFWNVWGLVCHSHSHYLYISCAHGKNAGHLNVRSVDRCLCKTLKVMSWLPFAPEGRHVAHLYLNQRWGGVLLRRGERVVMYAFVQLEHSATELLRNHSLSVRRTEGWGYVTAYLQRSEDGAAKGIIWGCECRHVLMLTWRLTVRFIMFKLHSIQM